MRTFATFFVSLLISLTALAQVNITKDDYERAKARDDKENQKVAARAFEELKIQKIGYALLEQRLSIDLFDSIPEPETYKVNDQVTALVYYLENKSTVCKVVLNIISRPSAGNREAPPQVMIESKADCHRIPLN